MRRILLIASATLLVTSVAAPAATPEDAIKYRKAVMTAMAGHVGAITLIFSGKVEHQEYLLSHAEALAAASEQTAKLFPPGSAEGQTEVQPLIWEEPERFARTAEDAKLAATRLREAVRSGDKAAVGQALKPVYDSCKDCHDRYRKEEQSM
jgi:cytochrome c556